MVTARHIAVTSAASPQTRLPRRPSFSGVQHRTLAARDQSLKSSSTSQVYRESGRSSTSWVSMARAYRWSSEAHRARCPRAVAWQCALVTAQYSMSALSFQRHRQKSRHRTCQGTASSSCSNRRSLRRLRPLHVVRSMSCCYNSTIITSRCAASACDSRRCPARARL